MTPDPRRIASAMGGDAHGDGGNYPAIGHSPKDRGVSFKIVSGAPDGIVLHCHNGGDPLAEKDLLRDRGLIDKFEPRRPDNRLKIGGRPAAPTAANDAPATAWEYCDADGVVVARKVRRDRPDGKSYSWQTPDGASGWSSGRGADPVPYRLPELLTADRRELIVMAEGEKCADVVAGLGFLSTSSRDLPKPLPTLFKGRTVAILPDEGETGRGYAEKAAESVKAAGGTAHVLDPFPGVPPGGDVVDWTDTGGTADELAALIGAAVSPPIPLLPMLDVAAMADRIPMERLWALAGLIPWGEVTLFTGPGGCGKSLAAQQLATCIAARVAFLRLATHGGGGALYLTAEDDERELHHRQLKIASALGVDLATLAGRLHLVSLRGNLDNELATFAPDGRLLVAELFNSVEATIRATGASFIVLDNVAHLFAGNENDRGHVTRFANLLNRLARDTGCTILLVAHPNKSGDSYSGSTAWLNAVRSHVTIDYQRDTDGAVVDRDARVLSVGKANYAPGGGALAFRWQDWAFIHDEDVPADHRAQIAANIVASGDNALFLECLDERNAQRRPVSEKVGPNYAPTQFVAMPDVKRKGITKQRMVEAMERLFGLGLIERGDAGWDDKKRRPQEGLIRVGGAPQTSAPNAPQTLAPDCPELHAQTAPTTYSIPKGISGAGPVRPPAPIEDEPEAGE